MVSCRGGSDAAAAAAAPLEVRMNQNLKIALQAGAPGLYKSTQRRIKHVRRRSVAVSI
jgi:hypothetical protein